MRLTGSRAVAALAVVGASLMTCGPSPAAGFRFTHMVSLRLTMSDHWARTPDAGCGPAGSGSVMWTQTWRRAVKATPELDAAAGRWVLLVPGPGGHSVLDLAQQRATAKITYANQVTVGGGAGCSGAIDTRGCRTYAIAATTNVFGTDRRSLAVLSTVRVGDGIRPPRSCLTGDYAGLNDPAYFRGKLSIRMPSAGLLRTRRKLVLTGSDTGHLHGPDFQLSGTIDETVTQTAVVTLTRIAG